MFNKEKYDTISIYMHPFIFFFKKKKTKVNLFVKCHAKTIHDAY